MAAAGQELSALHMITLTICVLSAAVALLLLGTFKILYYVHICRKRRVSTGEEAEGYHEMKDEEGAEEVWDEGTRSTYSKGRVQDEKGDEEGAYDRDGLDMMRVWSTFFSRLLEWIFWIKWPPGPPALYSFMLRIWAEFREEDIPVPRPRLLASPKTRTAHINVHPRALELFIIVYLSSMLAVISTCTYLLLWTSHGQIHVNAIEYLTVFPLYLAATAMLVAEIMDHDLETDIEKEKMRLLTKSEETSAAWDHVWGQETVLEQRVRRPIQTAKQLQQQNISWADMAAQDSKTKVRDVRDAMTLFEKYFHTHFVRKELDISSVTLYVLPAGFAWSTALFFRVWSVMHDDHASIVPWPSTISHDWYEGFVLSVFILLSAILHISVRQLFFYKCLVTVFDMQLARERLLIFQGVSTCGYDQLSNGQHNKLRAILNKNIKGERPPGGPRALDKYFDQGLRIPPGPDAALSQISSLSENPDQHFCPMDFHMNRTRGLLLWWRVRQYLKCDVADERVQMEIFLAITVLIMIVQLTSAFVSWSRHGIGPSAFLCAFSSMQMALFVVLMLNECVRLNVALSDDTDILLNLQYHKAQSTGTLQEDKRNAKDPEKGESFVISHHHRWDRLHQSLINKMERLDKPQSVFGIPITKNVRNRIVSAIGVSFSSLIVGKIKESKHK